jgi:hypothetical protein
MYWSVPRTNERFLAKEGDEEQIYSISEHVLIVRPCARAVSPVGRLQFKYLKLVTSRAHYRATIFVVHL